MSKAERVAEAQQLWAVEVITTTESDLSPVLGGMEIREGRSGGLRRSPGGLAGSELPGAQVLVWSLPTESGHSGRCADVEPWLFFSR